jgi:AmmeMemoRadiSam system protein B
MKIRPAAVAGTFYPADADELATSVDGYLAAGGRLLSEASWPVAPKALIVPHAGYVYSGPIAGTAYALVQRHGMGVQRVVLLGPAHRVALHGVAVSSADTFVTPLGAVPVDRASSEAALECNGVRIDDRAHQAEHSLEVHLPFLQRVLPAFRLVPLVVGSASGEGVARVIDHLWNGEETLVIVSSDLSHYHDYDTASRLDRATCAAIATLDPDGLDEEAACGRIPIRGLLRAARRHGLCAHLLDRRSSGDTAGDRNEVVGYAAFAFA